MSNKPKALHDYVPPMNTLESLQERFKDYFAFKFEDGILEVRMQTMGGPVVWSYQFHNALEELWTAIGHFTPAECLILTSTPPYWIGQHDPGSFAEVEQSGDVALLYERQVRGTLKIVENFLNDIEIPTIAAVNGIGGHWEFALFSDIALCSPDFVLEDGHYQMNGGHVPGDGMFLCMQQVLGVKKANYMTMTFGKMDAQQCLEAGVFNEIVDADKIVDRAWELARGIMQKSRPCRRLTHHLCVLPWKKLFNDDYRLHVLSEMYSFVLSGTAHDFGSIGSNAEE